MIEIPVGQRTATPAPYESASELRAANARLLEAMDRRLAEDASPEHEAAVLKALEPEILAFLRQGAETGVYVDDIEERTACQALLDYWTSSLSHADVLLPRARLAAFDQARLPVLPDRPRPFVGLDAFDVDTQRYFFGREKALEDLLRRIESNRLVVVQGASGSGKSSLVKGGALPLLGGGSAPRFRLVGPITPGNAILEKVVAHLPAGGALAEHGPAAVAQLRSDPGCLVALAGEAPPLLVVIDQFEEIFTLSSEADARALAAGLAALLQARPRDRVLLTMREEFTARLDDLVALRPLLEGPARFSMSAWPMGYEELKAAVEGPAARVNLHFQPGIVDHMVKSVLGSGDTALPLLQFTLQALWRERDRNRITWERYERIGGSPLAALERFADGVYTSLADEDRREFERVLLELVSVGRMLESYRRPVLRSQLLAAGCAQTTKVLAILEKHDFIRSTATASGSDAVVEVKHESLLRNWPLYRQWIDGKRERVRRRIALTEAAQRWSLAGKSARHGLLTAWQLDEVRSLGLLAGVEDEFVRASERALKRESSWKIARHVAATLLAVGALWIAYEARDARQSRMRQDLREQMAAAKEAATDGKLGHALTRAAAAARAVQAVEAGAQARLLRYESLSALLAVQARVTDLRRLFVNESSVFHAVALRPGEGGPQIAFAGSGGRTYVAAIDGPPSEKALDTCGAAFVTTLAFDPGGRRLAAGCADGTVSIWSMPEGKLLERGRLHVFDRTIWVVAFSKDGRLLAVAGYENKVRIIALDEDGNPLAGGPLDAAGEVPKGSVWSLAFSPREDRLLVGDGVGRLLACERTADAAWNCRDSAAYPTPRLDEPEDAIRAIAFSPDGSRLAVGRWLGQVDVWDSRLSPGAPDRVDLAQVSGPIYSLAFFAHCGARHLAIGKGSGLHYRRDPGGPTQASRPCSAPAGASVGDAVYGVAVHAPSGLLAAATHSGYVAVVDPAAPSERVRAGLQVPTRAREQVRGAILVEDVGSASIAVATEPVGPGLPSLTVLKLDLRDGRFTEISRGGVLVGEGYVRRVAASSSGGILATLAWLEPEARQPGGDRKPVVRVWTFDAGGRIADRPEVSLGREDFDGLAPRRIALSADGKWLAVAFDAPAPVGADANDSVRQRQRTEADRARQLFLLAVGSGGRGAWLETGLRTVREIAFSGDGRFFAAGGDATPAGTGAAGGEVRLWNVVPGGLEPRRLPAMALTTLANRVQEVSFAAEERMSRLPAIFGGRSRTLLVSAGEYGEIDAWDAETGTGHAPRRLDSQAVWLLAFSPERSILAAADSDHLVRLWHTERPDSEPIRISKPDEPPGLPGLLAFGRNGNWLASGAWHADSGGEISLWDLDIESLRRKVCTILRFSGEAASMAGTSGCP